MSTSARITGALLGLAIGDAVGWPAARHRAGVLPPWTRRLARELDTFAEEKTLTTIPVPMALNQPPAPLRIGPSDDAEWAVFTLRTALKAKDNAIQEALHTGWMELAGRTDVRARISTRSGLTNLANGLRPPASGHDNPHFFDDAACARAVALAMVSAGDVDQARTLAEFDAHYTQDEDGVHGALAIAAAVSAAISGAGTEQAVQAGLAELPAGSEIARNAHFAVTAARREKNPFALIPRYETEIVDHVYSYGVAAAETVPIALGMALAADGRFGEAVSAAACLSRVADSAPALTGALAGALGGVHAITESWISSARRLTGCCLPELAGVDLIELAEQV